ncbi:MAG: hypothetical protein F6K54_29860 [Okeania sp. SIO3B5]|uniref:hypothetical protein n=1 Tax=Okeania sp. SIO3B5 TaxID=2607811 RepID=UPI0014009598|nr:hypothetical protein [Okeania sp. SIO3B5]NEO56910.1 hypothetical protein [Okeania sp. SIO3B5]
MNLIETIKSFNWQRKVSVRHSFCGEIPDSLFESIKDEKWLVATLPEIQENSVFMGMTKIELKESFERKRLGDIIYSFKLADPIDGGMDYVAAPLPSIDRTIGNCFCVEHNISVEEFLEFVFKKTEKIASHNCDKIVKEIENYNRVFNSLKLSSAAKHATNRMRQLQVIGE